MRNIVEDYFEFYETFKEKYSEILRRKNIGILSEFLDNKNNIIEFHKKYVQPNLPKIAMCGINPGRKGAGIMRALKKSFRIKRGCIINHDQPLFLDLFGPPVENVFVYAILRASILIITHPL